MVSTGGAVSTVSAGFASTGTEGTVGATTGAGCGSTAAASSDGCSSIGLIRSSLNLLGDTTGYNQPLKTRPRGKVSSGGRDDGDAVLPRLSVEECLHYTLTLDPDVTLLGMSFPNEQDAAFAAARSFAGKLSAAMQRGIREHAWVAAGSWTEFYEGLA